MSATSTSSANSRRVRPGSNELGRGAGLIAVHALIVPGTENGF